MDTVAGPTILLVEDDDDTRESVAELLKDRGYCVVAKRDGAEAEAYLAAGPLPDCILLDLWMPVSDGWAFAAGLQRAGLARIPVVVLTAAEPQWGYPAGVRHILRKPVGPEALLALISDALRKDAGAGPPA